MKEVIFDKSVSLSDQEKKHILKRYSAYTKQQKKIEIPIPDLGILSIITNPTTITIYGIDAYMYALNSYLNEIRKDVSSLDDLVLKIYMSNNYTKEDYENDRDQGRLLYCLSNLIDMEMLERDYKRDTSPSFPEITLHPKVC